MLMNVEIISKEIIKPSSPTPHHLRNFKLSFLDQIAPPFYIPIIFFYQCKQYVDVDHDERTGSLKESLAETLTRFYPLAGTLNDEDFSINCNDEGVGYVQARVPCMLSQLVEKDNGQALIQLLPFEPDCSRSDQFGKEVLLAVQYNIFDCGGVAISFCFSHKVADGASAINFITAWAGMSRGANEIISPSFDAAIHFPPRDISGFTTTVAKEKIVTKRFVFDKSSIAALRKEAFLAFGTEDKGPSRVETVSAFICRRFIAIAQSKSGNKAKLFAGLHAVNLRGRMAPHLPVNSFGNLVTVAISQVKIEEDDCLWVNQLRNAIREINVDYVKKLQDGVDSLNFMNDFMNQLAKGETVFCNFTSWCNFPVYEIDFGMGKPTWVCSPNRPYKNVVVMMSSKDGYGIETWVNMNEEDMAMFEHDPELLSFVSSIDRE
ncbi:stemmadenine O-acetyltransferase [Quercus suber]|uniref:Vinorine synthase n=1 Tax=Quercus suber TaxID=58331 RepID=A0AAW0J071_QUESU|nr:vinorine synthase-like [Quercus suber]POE68082.1 vinorine synthase [Quercus suber]